MVNGRLVPFYFSLFTSCFSLFIFHLAYFLMPQMYIHSPDETTRLAVWHITEPESFFLKVVTAGKLIAHPHKRLQHLCGRYLLRHLAPRFPMSEIVAEQYNKPFVPEHSYHFSISHCDDYAAAIVSTTQQVGIDVEMVVQRVIKIRHKFLSSREEAILVNNCSSLDEVQRLTLAWSTKETMYKWLGETGIDFKEHLILNSIKGSETEGFITTTIHRKSTQQLLVAYRFLQNNVLTWTVI